MADPTGQRKTWLTRGAKLGGGRVLKVGERPLGLFDLPRLAPLDVGMGILDVMNVKCRAEIPFSEVLRRIAMRGHAPP